MPSATVSGDNLRSHRRSALLALVDRSFGLELPRNADLPGGFGILSPAIPRPACNHLATEPASHRRFWDFYKWRERPSAQC